MGLYTFLYENLLYRLYIIHIQPARIVTARLSRYTAHTAYTAIQPYTPYIIQRHTASLRPEPGRPQVQTGPQSVSYPGGEAEMPLHVVGDYALRKGMTIALRIEPEDCGQSSLSNPSVSPHEAPALVPRRQCG